MKFSMYLHTLFAGFFLLVTPLISHAECQGRFIDPIQDICWSCLFPLTIGDNTVTQGADDVDTDNPSNPQCICWKGLKPRVGITLGFWEPARLIEVTRTPYCLVSLDGMQVDSGVDIGQGGQKSLGSTLSQSQYQAHGYTYLPLYWLDMMFSACTEKAPFALNYMSELDPSWQDDAIALWLTPEAVQFANPAAQLSCATECAATAANGLPMDALHWCGGCQGSLYPLTGHVSRHIGGVQASTLIAQKFTAKLHRQGLLPGTMGKGALCGTYAMPVMKKSQYKLQMTYPKASTSGKYATNPYGRSTTFWEAGKEYPITGEDFAYLVWRKRNCCAF